MLAGIFLGVVVFGSIISAIFKGDGASPSVRRDPTPDVQQPPPAFATALAPASARSEFSTQDARKIDVLTWGFERISFGLESGLFLMITNGSDFVVKDLELRINWYSKTQSPVRTDRITLYELLGPGDVKRVAVEKSIFRPSAGHSASFTFYNAVALGYRPLPTPEEIAARTAATNAAKKAAKDDAASKLQSKSIAFERALMEKGEGLGYYMIGRRHLKGDGLEKNEAKARELLETAVEKGNNDASFLLKQMDSVPAK